MHPMCLYLFAPPPLKKNEELGGAHNGHLRTIVELHRSAIASGMFFSFPEYPDCMTGVTYDMT